ncbi:hypothetical protein CVAR_3078 [Corynebacterium variabile DSM 44702]|uniref:Uncharacterized protein n=2 Tax=Corynebacterium variabile TaxID=1727 RepID=G0HI04_CORVD|nr:hypothetical protein CVAR_3078 [Corynebacterium variabile DSM 44702]
MADELASVEASPQHPSLTAARESAADLRHRISLHTVTLAPRPLVLPGVAPLPSAGHPVNALPELWHRHRHDPVRRPSHQDAVGHPGPDGAPLDGEGGRLTDGFRTHWVDVPLAAAADPATPLSEIDALTDHSVAVLRRYGAGAAEIAGLRARVLLATGRLEQARELMELVGEVPCGVEELAVVGGTVALLRGDLDTLLRVLCHGEDTGLAAGTGSSVQWTLLTAASLVPLAHMVDTTTTVDRIAGIVATATGAPELVPAMLHVAGYLALAGVPETALSLLVRTVDITDPPAAAAPVLRAVAETGWSADPAADLGARRLVAGGPTVRELADGLSEQLREQAVCCDARNGRMMWTTLVPEALEYPVPLIDAADLVGIPALGGLALPAALPTALPGAFPGGTTDPADLAELPGVGPVDLASFDATDALCATVMYTLLGLTDAADCVVDRMRFLTADDGDPVVLDVAAEFVRRSDCAAGHGVGCFACARQIAPSARGLLTEVDRMVRECACAGTSHDAPGRVRTMTRLWSDAHPLVRRLIDLDILLSGALATRPSAEYAVQGLWTALRLLPRAVPLTGGALVEAETGRGIVDATVITAVTASARSLPAPPSASPLGLVDHVADLADLADALVTAGACHEACTVAAAGLAAVGGNWVDTGVASGCASGEAGADDDGPVRLLRARSAALSSLGNTAGADRCAEAAATAAEYRGRWRLAEACRVDAAGRRA